MADANAWIDTEAATFSISSRSSQYHEPAPALSPQLPANFSTFSGSSSSMEKIREAKEEKAAEEQSLPPSVLELAASKSEPLAGCLEQDTMRKRVRIRARSHSSAFGLRRFSNLSRLRRELQVFRGQYMVLQDHLPYLKNRTKAMLRAFRNYRRAITALAQQRSPIYVAELQTIQENMLDLAVGMEVSLQAIVARFGMCPDHQDL